MPLTRPKAAQVNFDVTNITDPLLRINSSETGSADKDTGIVIERGSDQNVALIYDESADQFAVVNTDETGTTSGNVTISSYAGLQADAIVYGSLNDGTTSLTSTAAELNLLDGVTGTLVTESATQTLTNKTMTAPVLNAPVFGTGTNSPYFTEIRYNTSNMMKFNQMYTGAATGSYFDPNEYQKVVTITPAGNSENYQVSGRIMAQNAGEIHTVNFTAALRSGDPLPDLSWTINYTEEYNGSRYIDPQLWTKETTTAGFIFAFKVLSRIYGTVTVDMDIIPRTSSLLSNVAVNSTQNSEQSSVDAGFTARDMTKIKSTRAGRFGIGTEPYTDAHFHIKNDDVGLEFSLDGAISNETRILSYDRTANTRRGMVLDADHLDLKTGGTTRFLVNSDGSMTVTGDIIPDANNTRDLGSSGTKFAEVHATTFHGQSTSAQYADLAEMYAGDEKYAPGTVLIFGGDAEVTTTTMMADHRVAGVVSTNPAYLMNSDAEGVAVALRGRIPCFVEGPVHKGDIIVSGVKAGTGVALTKDSALPNAVCVVGKAIEENLETGVKLIEVVV